MGNHFREQDLGTTVGECKAGIRRDAKRWGELGELAFILKAASLGITASKPFGDRRPYDFLVEHGQRLLRIQVKSVFTRQGGSWRFGFSVAVSKHPRSGKRVTYTADQIDFIVAFVAPHDAWYVIPVDAISGRTFIRLYPGGATRSDAGRFEPYREAWHLLEDGAPAFKRSFGLSGQ
jgi:uncharacterized protein YneR